jgi:PEGA domain/Tetratricopeptide repeat
MKQLLIFAILAIAPAIAFGDPPESPTKQAGEHFDRGVAMYNEADYRAALVEFKKAYEIAPNAAVLYNLGQTYYQLQNYAEALSAFEQYMQQSGDSPSHEAEVRAAIKTLKSRVGKVMVTTNVPGAEITVDDELAGKAPLTAAMDVSIGHRKITVLHNGNQPETRYVDVAAGDLVKLEIDLAAPASEPGAQPLPPAAEARPRDRTDLAIGGWIATGALAVGAITVGAIAWNTSNQLSDLRNTFPADPSELNSKSSHVTTLSAIADGLGAAAIIAGGISLYWTVTRHRGTEVRAAFLPGGMMIAGSFR